MRNCGVLVAVVAALALACSAPARLDGVAPAPATGASASSAPAPIATGPATSAPSVEPLARTVASTEALIDGARRGDVVAVSEQIAAGADVRSRGARGRTSLHAAAQGGHIAVARALLNAGAEVSAQDLEGDTPYSMAALARHAELTGILLDAGADRVGTRAYGGTPLIAIAERGWVDVAREILRRPNIPVNHVNNLGWTALIEAIVLGRGGVEHQEIVRLLLEAGADPNLPDGMGRSPRTLAAERGYSEIVTLVGAAGGR